MFSIIMPVYNHAEYLPEAIDSVRAQSFADWELIVIDDGSTDGSGGIAESYAARDGRLRFLRQSNAGPAAARNAALRRARADWLAYLDSDDTWYAGTLQAYQQAIATHPHEEFFYGYRDRMNRDGSLDSGLGHFQDRPTGAVELFGRMYLSHMCVCYRRALLDRVGGYDARLRSCEDYELYLRMSLLTRFVPIGRATGLRRRHERNISRASGFSRFQEAEVLRRFVQRQGGREVVPPRLVRRRLSELYRSAATHYLREQRPNHALAALRQSLRLRLDPRPLCLLPLAAMSRRRHSPPSTDLPWLAPDE